MMRHASVKALAAKFWMIRSYALPFASLLGNTERITLAKSLSTKIGKPFPTPDSSEATPAVGMPWTRKLFSSRSTVKSEEGSSRKYAWIDEEAEKLINEAYKIHLPEKPFPPSIGFDRKNLENLKSLPHLVPVTVSDKVALLTVKVLENVMHLFFRKKYDHHAVTLETVAAVPGFVAAMHRHMRSLRRMKRDHGWIDVLLEESTNERMHLLIWMQHTKPNQVERLFVLFAQALYITFYSTMYVVSPQTAHRTVGYLEEAAFRAYTDYLEAVDRGEIPNASLKEKSIAKKFYRLDENATLRDVILHVRADEAFHALYNHGLSNQIRGGGIDEEIYTLEDDLKRMKRSDPEKK
jgi:ubiquinol oxidase